MSTPTTHKSYIDQNVSICGGQSRITGTRLKVQQIALEYEYLGWSPDQICDAHPEIGLPQVHAAISYYYDHKSEIDRQIQEDKEFAGQLRKELPR